MVSGGMVLVVSIVCVESTGTMVLSVVVLSELPDTFFVELHADVATNIVPAKARLKINFFIGWLFKFVTNLFNNNPLQKF